MRCCLAFAIIAAAIGPARADPGGESFAFIAGHLGLGPPVGNAGLELGLGWSWLRASAGAGFGFKGVQTAVQARVVLPSEPGTVQPGVGVAISQGPAISDLGVGAPGDSSSQELKSHGPGTVWASGEISLDYVRSPTMTLRLYGGVSKAIRTDCRVQIDDNPTMACTDEQARELSLLPYVAASVEWRFVAAQ